MMEPIWSQWTCRRDHPSGLRGPKRGSRSTSDCPKDDEDRGRLSIPAQWLNIPPSRPGWIPGLRSWPQPATWPS